MLGLADSLIPEFFGSGFHIESVINYELVFIKSVITISSLMKLMYAKLNDSSIICVLK